MKGTFKNNKDNKRDDIFCSACFCAQCFILTAAVLSKWCYTDALGWFEFAACFACLLIKSLLVDAVTLKAKRQHERCVTHFKNHSLVIYAVIFLYCFMVWGP